jgi:hypothetical protein
MRTGTVFDPNKTFSHSSTPEITTGLEAERPGSRAARLRAVLMQSFVGRFSGAFVNDYICVYWILVSR